jgi:acetaldehyde dehydrogenase (acetylating)
MGHTMSIHSRNDAIILEFGLKKPAFRIVVNTPTTLGSIGLTTGLDPSMTLGCGGWGGNITSDNISPMHLLNIKRLAYETNPLPVRRETTGAGGAAALPRAPSPPRVAGGIPAAPLARRIDEFLASRGYVPPGGGPQTVPSGTADSAAAQVVPKTPGEAARPAAEPGLPANLASGSEKVADFVCEDDVRQAIRQGRRIVIGERTIVTPAARDLAEEHRIFIQAAWPR